MFNLVAASLLMVSLFIIETSGHGHLYSPISRDALWTKGYSVQAPVKDTKENNDICGHSNYSAPTVPPGCGPCGKSDFPSLLGPIVETYTVNRTIMIAVQFVDAHMGWMSFKVCPTPDALTDDCFNKYPLVVQNSPLPSADPSQYTWTHDETCSDVKYISATLPTNLLCDHCVFQWHLQGRHNSSDLAPVWRQCADVSIKMPYCDGD